VLQEIVEVTGHSGIFLFEGMKSSEIPKNRAENIVQVACEKPKKP
jgi:hypothetical protein